ncbi:MAG: nucleotidyltransferase family protein [bacterium]
MKTVEEIKNILKKHKADLRERYKVKEIGIFGSFVRGDHREGSDLDVLVDFEEPIGLDYVEMADFLESILGEKVDLVSRGAIKPDRWKYIVEDLIYV